MRKVTVGGLIVVFNLIDFSIATSYVAPSILYIHTKPKTYSRQSHSHTISIFLIIWSI